MHFHEKLEEKAAEMMEELPGDFKRQGGTEGARYLELFSMFATM
jgi:hypothetical protein